MEERKIQSLGGSSLIITLPKDWVKKSKVKSGDKVSVYAHTDRLVVSVFHDKTPTKGVLKIGSMSHSQIKRELVSFYLSGVEVIELRGKGLKERQRMLIRDIKKFLIGFEIVESNSNKVVMKNIFDNKKLPTWEALERIFKIAISMAESGFQVINEGDKELIKNVVERDFELNNLCRVLDRQFRSLMADISSKEAVKEDFTGLYFFNIVAGQIERIADHMAKIVLAVADEKKKYPAQTISILNDLITELITKLKDSILMVKDLDKERAHKILDEDEKLEKRIQKNYLDEKSCSSLIIVRDSLNRFRGYLKNIAEATIDQRIYFQTRKDF